MSVYLSQPFVQSFSQKLPTQQEIAHMSDFEKYSCYKRWQFIETSEGEKLTSLFHTTLLHLAILNDQTGEALSLISEEHNDTIFDDQKRTALFLAVTKSNKAVFDALLTKKNKKDIIIYTLPMLFEQSPGSNNRYNDAILTCLQKLGLSAGYYKEWLFKYDKLELLKTWRLQKKPSAYR